MNINTFDEIPDAQLEEIRHATALDSTMREVIRLVMEGWPEEKRSVPRVFYLTSTFVTV